jgi:hypothetical protein
MYHNIKPTLRPLVYIEVKYRIIFTVFSGAEQYIAAILSVYLVSSLNSAVIYQCTFSTVWVLVDI